MVLSGTAWGFFYFFIKIMIIYFGSYWIGNANLALGRK